MLERDGPYVVYPTPTPSAPGSFYLAVEMGGVFYIYNGRISSKKHRDLFLGKRDELIRSLDYAGAPLIVLPEGYSRNFPYYSEQKPLLRSVEGYLSDHGPPTPPPPEPLHFERDERLYSDLDERVGF